MMHFIDRRLNPKGKSLTNRQRFIRRARTQIRKAVKEAINDGKVADVGHKGRISIPTKGLNEPRFRYDYSKGKHDRILPGNKEFSTGDQIKRPPKGGEGQGGKKASEEGEGEDSFQFSLSREEFLEVFFEDLELPDLIKTSLKEEVDFEKQRAGYVRSGSPSNMDLKRTMRHSLARRISMKRPGNDELDELRAEILALEAKGRKTQKLKDMQEKLELLENRRRFVPYIDPLDVRYKSFIKIPKPNTHAVMFCLMDVSGSMSEGMKDLAKRFFMLLHLFLSTQYERVELVFIRHTHLAKEVDEETFFYSRETGGTIVSSALEEMKTVLEDRYPQGEWNIYAAQASDGDNFASDREKCLGLMNEAILPFCQYFAYIEVMDEQELEIFKDEQNMTDLWRIYAQLTESFENFAMRRVVKPNDIFPVFKDLFSKEQAKKA
ncbi:YeaH/YhbH family protein [Kiloniella laminariae]|uniref:YeaH/YhbH family protein n=1 Tax=Kiloniella laminariae TaxID=454162 RepID=UPI00037A1DD2|nr:YeaH/YhbH family protein [Kiloniella laminariae]